MAGRGQLIHLGPSLRFCRARMSARWGMWLPAPPSTLMICPVTNPASGEHRNTTIAAMSAGSPEPRREVVAQHHLAVRARVVVRRRGRDDQAGCDGVAPDPGLAVLRGGVAGQRVDRRLGDRRRRCGPKSPAEACAGRRVHDAAPAGRDEVRQRELGRQHRARQVDPHRRLPDLGVHVGDVQVACGREMGSGGVVVQDVQAAEPGHGLLDERLSPTPGHPCRPRRRGPALRRRRCGSRHARRRRRRGRQPPPMRPRARVQSRTRGRCPMPTR